MSRMTRMAAAYVAAFNVMNDMRETIDISPTRDPFLRNDTGHRGSKPDREKTTVRRRKQN